MKWVSVFPQNIQIGKPTVQGTILLNSPETGELLAVIEANAITAFRTAAASVLASLMLARKNPETLAIVGAGLQADYQLRAHLTHFNFKKVVIWGFKLGEAKALCERFKNRKEIFEAVDSIEACVKNADVIVTCTPAREPLVKSVWISKGTHINAIGADAHGKEELEASLIQRARIIVDEWEQAAHSGEINVPVSQGLFKKEALAAELAEVVAGTKPGRLSPDDITIFDSTGLSVLDIHFAQFAYKHTPKTT